jgi:hypothetical protein
MVIGEPAPDGRLHDGKWEGAATSQAEGPPAAPPRRRLRPPAAVNWIVLPGLLPCANRDPARCSVTAESGRIWWAQPTSVKKFYTWVPDLTA